MQNIKKTTFLVRFVVMGAVVLSLIASAAPSFAQTMREGQVVHVQGTILCDRASQLQQIANAQQTSFPAALAVLQEINQGRNELGEMPCAILPRPVPVRLIADVAHVTDLKFPDGSVRSMYLVAVMWRHRTEPDQPGFIFFEFPVGDQDV